MDLDIRDRTVHLQRITEQDVVDASFLDNRLDIDWASANRVPLSSFEGLGTPARPPVWVWHTSFCGSTLLARALGFAPHSVSLREPLVLRRLADARHDGVAIDSYFAPVVALLSRPWHPEGRVVIKPTHAALNVAVNLMEATPGSKAIVLTSSLEDFLVSHLKKSHDTLAKIPLLVERAMQASDYVTRLEPPAFEPPSILCAAALQWAAQREVVSALRARIGTERVRVFDWRGLLKDVPEFTAGAVRWAALDVPESALRAHVAHIASRHAKATMTPYSAAERDREAETVRGLHAYAIALALDWSQRWLVPALSSGAQATAERWT